MPYLDDIAAELRAIDSWAARNERADAAAAGITGRQAENMALAARMWPGLSPGALLALGRGDYAPDDPLAMQLATLSEQERMRNHPYDTAYGQPSITKAMGPDAARLLNQQSSAQRQADYATGRATHRASLTPGQRRVEDAQVGGADPHSADLVEAAIARGILRPDGTVVQVTSPTEIDPDTGHRTYASPFAQRTDEIFHEVMSALAERQGNDDPIPFLMGAGTDEKGQTGLYRPRTGAVEVIRPHSGEPTVPDLPGPFDDWFKNGQTQAQALLHERRMPDPLGASRIAPTIAPSAAGYTSPADVIRQGVFMPLDAGAQELQGQVRNLYALAHGDVPDFWETQSDFGIALSTGKDSGTGFFTDQESAVAAERRRREAERGQIGGHNVTLGRWLVDGLTPFDPDTKPAMILSGLTDAAVQLYADPSALALGEVGRGIRARQVFATAPDEGVGVVHGLRSMVGSEVQASKFLDEDMLRADGVMHTWADTDNAYDIWRMSGHKLPIRMAGRIADDAHTADEVRAIVEPAIGGRIREVSTLSTDIPRRSLRPNTMPIRGKIDAHDPDIVAREIESFMHNIPGTTDDQIAAAIARAARADDPIALNRAIRDSLTDSDGLLAAAGITDANWRKTLTQMAADTHEEIQSTFVETLTHQGPTDNPFLLAGEELRYPGAQLVTELAPRYITLPDARTIRRVTSRYKNLIATPEGDLRLPLAFLENFQNEIWKPLQLMRPAWLARVVGEEQIRMAGAGYDSMFKHPLSFIAWRLAHKGQAPAWMREGAEGGIADIKGAVMGETNTFKDAMSGQGEWVDRAIVSTGVPTNYTNTEIGNARNLFNESWGSELIRLHMDPVAQHVAHAESFDEAVEWFTRGGGNKYRAQLATAKPGQFDTIEDARSYLETVQRRIDYATSGNDTLLEAVRTGRLDGTDLMSGHNQHPDLAGRLESLHDDFAPLKLRGEEQRTLSNKGIANRWRQGVDHMFSILMTNRTNNLSRAPVYDQAYFRRVEEMLPQADPAVRDEIIDMARQGGAPSRAIKRMKGIRSTGTYTADEINDVAHGFAIDETKELLYDLTRKGRFMDAARLVFPFGEAWSEVLTRWFGRNGIIRNNPKVIRRFQQTIQAARGEDFGQVMTGEPGGFFTTNEFGEEVFTIPGSKLLTDKLLGVPVPMTGNVQGLSMFGTIMPGLGPVIQMPVAALIENKPGPQAVKKLFGLLETTELPVLNQTIKEQIVPFGSPVALDQGEALNVYNFLPAWMRTGLNAFFNDDVGATQTYGNTVLSMAAYLRSTGRYGNSKADQQQLMEDAAFEARNFTIIKALVQSTAPASPSPDWLLEANGREVRARALGEEYQKLKKDDFATADQTFYERYGADVLAAVQSKTRGAVYGVPTTREGANWVMQHPGIEDQLPNTYGFFAPQGDPDDFDTTLYQAQVQAGQRQILNLEQYTRVMSDAKADLLYHRAQDMAGDDHSAPMQAWLRDVRERIHEQYPRWQDESGLFGKADTETLVRELYEAADNPTIRDTEAGKGLALYLQARDQAMDEAESRGRAGFATSQDTEDLRSWLNDVAGRIIDKYPAFATTWEFVLSRETEVTDG